jgi:hypothetical protein
VLSPARSLLLTKMDAELWRSRPLPVTLAARRMRKRKGRCMSDEWSGRGEGLGEGSKGTGQ